MITKSGKEFFTTGEIAQICHVNATTIFRAIRGKHIKAATTPGGHFRVSRSALQSFLRKNKIPYGGAEFRAKRILIVEDNPLEMRFFQRVLETEKNLAVKTTASGYEAGFLTQSFQPQVILLDIYLPDMDGREVARLIRSDPKLRRTRIVAITASRDPNDHQECLAAGFDGLLEKPVTDEALKKTVLSLLKER